MDLFVAYIVFFAGWFLRNGDITIKMSQVSVPECIYTLYDDLKFLQMRNQWINFWLSYGYKKCKELYSTKVSVLAVKYLLVILHRLPTYGGSQLAIPVVQYTGTWSNTADHTVMNPYVYIYKASETLLFKPSSFIV